uniref:DUF4794 domain-containing protein n=1 Tax=Anopheles atroparvus TaxID=41427 RepID=A0AAG5CUR7_ANOAO
MYSNFALVTALLLVTPFVAGSPLPVPLRSNLGAQNNMDIHLPDGATSVSAETINNLAIVIAETVYIMSDGSVVPEVPGTTLVPPTSAPTQGPTNPGAGPTTILTPPPFPGRK